MKQNCLINTHGLIMKKIGYPIHTFLNHKTRKQLFIPFKEVTLNLANFKLGFALAQPPKFFLYLLLCFNVSL